MHHLRTVGLQFLDHVLAGQQAALLLVEALDFLVLRLDLGDFILEEVVALGLAGHLAVIVEPQQEGQQQARDRRCTQHHVELALSLDAALGTPRE
ncbi:hypothetical protein D9M68_965560 [compost metagenome]